MPEPNGSGSRRRTERIGSAPTRRSSRSPRRPLILFAVGGAVAGLIVLFLLGSIFSRPPAEPPPPLGARPPRVPKPDPAPPALPEPAKPRPEDGAERRRLEEEKKEAAAEQERVRAEAERRERARRDAARRAYAIRKLKRREASARALEEARRRVKEDRAKKAARQEALRRKLEGRKISVRLKNGMTLENVVVRGMSADEIRLGFTFEGAVAEQSFPTAFIEGASTLGLLREVFGDEGASGAYEMGRHLVLWKLWAEADKAFKRCVGLDAAYADRIPDLSRILKNEAAFRGSARRIGDDRLFIAYDFSDAAMAQDFTVQQPGELTVEEGELRIRTKKTSIWSLKDVDFTGELEIDAVGRIEGEGSLVLGCFFTWDKKGYLVVLNSSRHSGHVLYRSEGSKLTRLAVCRGSLLPPGEERRIRCVVRNGAVRVYVGSREILAAADATFDRGWFTLGAAAGSVRLSKLTVQGRVAPAEIDKRFAEVEILVRRALEADLGRGDDRQEADGDLSGEDATFTEPLDDAFLADYGRARAELMKALRRRRLRREDLALFDALAVRAPEFAPVHYWRGRIARAARRPEIARQCFARAVKLNPDFHEAHLGLAHARLEERDLAAARAGTEQALALAPGHGPTRALAGFLEYVGGDVKKALAELELARRLAPADSDVHDLHRTVLNVIKGPQHLGCKYVKEFPHYTVMTDMSPEKTLRYGRRLEAARAHFEKTVGALLPGVLGRTKPRVAIFNTREAYLTYGELTISGRHEWTLGYYHPLFRELLLFEDVDLDASLHTLYHEAFHEYLGERIGRVPYWLNEGLAEYMGGLRVEIAGKDARVVERARVLTRRLRTLRAGLDRTLSFREIMSQSPGQFYSGRVSFKYAQAWAMVHFLFEDQEGRHRSKIEAYLRALRDGGSASEAFDAAFRGTDLDALQREWAGYVKRLEPPK